MSDFGMTLLILGSQAPLPLAVAGTGDIAIAIIAATASIVNTVLIVQTQRATSRVERVAKEKRRVIRDTDDETVILTEKVPTIKKSELDEENAQA